VKLSKEEWLMSIAAVVVERRFEGATVYCLAPSIRLRIRHDGTLRLSAAACNAARLAAGSPAQMPPSSPALLIGELAVSLQRAAGFACGAFGQSGENGDTAFIDYEAPDSKTGVAACLAAGEMVSILLDSRFDPAHPRELEARAKKFLTDYSRGGKHAITDYMWAAASRGLPWRRIAPDSDIYEIGHGRKRRLYLRHSTMATPQVSCLAGTRKSIAARMMREAGLPVPPHHIAGTEGEALAAAEALGFPVVIKPESTDFGIAVTADIRTMAEVKTAFELARKHGRVLVERHLEGANHRLLVIHGRLASAVRHTPAHVIGDGQSSVAGLVERTNMSRSEGLSESWKKISFDSSTDILLEKQGFDRLSVPPAGVTVWLRQQSNLSTGGTMENVTPLVHPGTVHMAERAAAILGLDVAGIDFITADISQPPEDGGICEINPNPGFIMGEPGDRLENLFLEPDFPAGETGRIPIVVVLHAGARPGFADDIAYDMARSWPGLGIAQASGISIAGQRVAIPQFSAAEGTRALLADPACSAVLQITTPEELTANGLGCDRIDLAILSPAGSAAARLIMSLAAQTVHPDAGAWRAPLRALAAAAPED
jgi:cyanophycin synthetase